MYDAYRPPSLHPKPRFWTRPKVGAAGAVLGLIVGVAATGTEAEAEPEREQATPAQTAPAQVVQGSSDAEVEEAVARAVGAADDDLQGRLADQRKQARSELRAVRSEARADQAEAVRAAVAETLASVPRPVVDTPDAPPASSTDPRFSYCYEVNDAGYGNYVSGADPEYDWYDDTDNDGVVCET